MRPPPKKKKRPKRRIFHFCFVLFVQDAAGCRGRERTFRNDIKLKGRKDFFSSSSKLLSTEAFLSFSRRRSVRIVFFLSLSLSRALLRVNALTHDSR